MAYEIPKNNKHEDQFYLKLAKEMLKLETDEPDVICSHLMIHWDLDFVYFKDVMDRFEEVSGLFGLNQIMRMRCEMF